VKLIIDTIRWVAGHLVSVAVLLCVLFGAHLVVNVLLPHWEKDRSLLTNKVKRLEERRDQILSEIPRKRVEAEDAMSRFTAIHVRHIEGGLKELREDRKALTLRAEEYSQRVVKYATAKMNRDQLCDPRRLCPSWVHRWWDRNIGDEKCKRAAQLCEDARAQARALHANWRSSEGRLRQARGAVARAIQGLAVQPENLSPEDAGKLKEAGARLSGAQKDLGESREAHARSESELADARAALESSPRSRIVNYWSWLKTEFKRVFARHLTIILVFGFVALSWPFAWYWIFMPLISRRPPLRLRGAGGEGTASLGPSRHSLDVSIPQGERLAVRADWLVAVGDEQGKAKRSTRWFWSWTAPALSYAARLFLLTEVRGEGAPDGAPAALAVLAPPADPDLSLSRLELKEGHPGFIVKPRHVVGIQGDVKLEAVWAWRCLHALATWQIRYYRFSGTGALYLAGHGGLTAVDAADIRLRLDDRVVAGFDVRLTYRAMRTETFFPYLLGRASLVDDSFTGAGLVLREAVSGARSARTPIERGFQSIAGVVGKFFGF